MRNTIVYRGYEINRSILTGQWYADPTTAITTEQRLRADDCATIKNLVDQATAENTVNPWQLPSIANVPAAA